MEEISKHTVLSRWGLTNLAFWPLYTAAMFWIFYWVREQPGYLDWPVMLKGGVVLVPLLPVTIWLLMMGRMFHRTRDGLEARLNIRAAAMAGLVTMLALFAHGLYGIVFGNSMLMIVNDIDLTSFVFIGIFLVMFSMAISLSKIRHLL